MKYLPSNHFRESGFSLIEMAIVLFIVALLLGGLLPTVSGQFELQHRRDTRKQLDEIQQALIGYAIINGRLPCPADKTTPSGQSNTATIPAGQENLTSIIGPPFSCVNAEGVLPWATLGVPETDAWGHRFSYRVTLNFADDIGNIFTYGCSPTTNPPFSSFALCSNGDINIFSAASGGVTIANNIPAVVVSHGTNGTGAYTSQGSQIPIDITNADESKNASNTINFVNHDTTPTFDDLVVWISPNILLNRMVTAGKLP